jgi:multidrug efflux pump subunit AcrB
VLITLAPLGLRSSLIVMISIPLCLALGLAALQWVGYTLNQLSIVGFVIALGLVVDDAIVVVENIARSRREGYPPIEAARRATRQIAVAVVGTTATLLFAFIPLVMLPEASGQFIRSLPVAVIFSVLASLFIALTVVPWLASLLLTGREDPEGNAVLRVFHRVIAAVYRPLLHWCMQHRLPAVFLAAIFPLASLALVPSLGFSLFPKADTPQFLVQITAAEGASIGATDAIVQEVEALLHRQPEVLNTFATIGQGNPQIYYNVFQGDEKPNLAEIFVSLKAFDPRRTPALIEKLRQEADRIPGAQIVFKEFENGPPINAPIEVRVVGDDLAEISRLAGEVETVVRSTPGTRNVDNPARVRRTDLKVRLDHDQLAVLGMNESSADQAVRVAFAGLDAGKFRESNGDERTIRVVLPQGDHATLAAWSAAQVPTGNGSYTPLSQIADLELSGSPALVERRNRERLVTVSAYPQAGFNTDRLTRAVRDRLQQIKLPNGYRFDFGGELETREESFAGFGNAILLAVFGIMAILVLEFKSFRGTLIVASVIPLGIVGGLVGLWLTGYTLSFMSMIGFVALIGIEIKNSILLVDFTNQLRSDGVPLDEAIERAGETRFLPVVLTTLTALGALLPLALQRSAFYSPLAIVIIGGSFSSLLLSRLVTPVLYRIFPPNIDVPEPDLALDPILAPAPVHATL